MLEWSSRLEMDHRVYVTLSHLISLRMGGKVGRKDGRDEAGVNSEEQWFDIHPNISLIFIPAVSLFNAMLRKGPKTFMFQVNLNVKHLYHI